MTQKQKTAELSIEASKATDEVEKTYRVYQLASQSAPRATPFLKYGLLSDQYVIQTRKQFELACSRRNIAVARVLESHILYGGFDSILENETVVKCYK